MSANPSIDYNTAHTTPVADLSKAEPHGHAVQFYENDSVLLEGLSRSIGAALGAGDGAIIVATKAHRHELAERLQQRGIDLGIAIRQGRYVAWDAAETLSQFMVDGRPDAERFIAVLGNVIDQVTSAAACLKGGTATITAFGEMVALLWSEGRPEAALQLETLWNQLARTRAFHLHCAYPLNQFKLQKDSEAFERICAEHSCVIPAESYTLLGNEDDRLRAITLLQQKALALEAEIAERRNAQSALQRREDELRDFLENAVVGMHWVAGDGTILWANRAEMNLLGYSPDEYIGHHIAEFHADGPVIEDILQRLSRNEELHGYEARLRHKDGSIRQVRIHSNVYRESEKFVHTRCFTLDITDKKAAEEAWLRLASIVESSDDGIASKDLNGVVTSWNAGAERIFGYRAEEIVGRPITILIPEELQDDERMILGKIRKGEKVDHFETVRVTKSGERIHVSLTISPVRDKQGNIAGAAKIMRNITQRKQLEEALHMSERLASVGRLAATVAHEINNPLEAIVNNIYLAKQVPGLPEKVLRHLKVADEELSRVSNIAQQTLGFYRGHSGPIWVDVAESLSSVLAIYERKLHYKKVRVETKIPANLQIYTREGELKQTISNLIANAIDASHVGGTIWIRAQLRNGTQPPSVRISVADNGAGMSEQVKSKLFSPFFTTKEQVGTGLGLWNSRSLMEKQGGTIRMRSRENKGTVMSIFLPLAAKSLATSSGARE